MIETKSTPTEKFESGKRRIYVATSIVVILGYISDDINRFNIFNKLHLAIDFFALLIIVLCLTSYLLKFQTNYKLLFAITSWVVLINTIVAHLFFYEYIYHKKIEFIFMRDFVFCLCILLLSGFIVSKKQIISQSVSIILLLCYYRWIRAPYITQDFTIIFISISGFGYLAYFLVSTIQRFISSITDRDKVLQLQHKEITSSLQYAKRIQAAILPSQKLVTKLLRNSFVLYKPKDIVAGDFYWLAQVDDMVLFAVADCTGHGVPGAMVSVVCNNALNRSVREFGLLDPGQILNKTQELVVQEFEKSDEEVKDGMDIALCTLRGTELLYAGANNPLWIIRNTSEFIQIKATKQSISKSENTKPFLTHSFSLQSGDHLYLFSDGFADQFGGLKGKKIKKASLKKVLLENQKKPMDVQCQILEKSFESWRGELEQIDDVCVLGVAIV